MAMTAKEKAAAKKQLAAAQALLAKQKANLAALEAGQKELATLKTESDKDAAELITLKQDLVKSIPGASIDKVTGKIVVPTISAETRDAFEGLKILFTQYGLGELSSTIEQMMQKGLTPSEATTALKYDKSINPATGQPWNAAYTKRFAGNAARVAKGLNAYDEATYLDVENSYEETLRRYGLGNMISTNREANQAKWASYMANDLAAPEFATRIKEVSDGVLNMDAATKSQWKTYYPSLTDSDIVAYFLDPKQTMPMLEEKVKAAQVGAVAGAAGYGITRERAEEFAKFGVSREGALTGYQNVATVLPSTSKQADIYNEESIQYNQTDAENEFLKKNPQAELKRNRLASKERASFQARSGVSGDTLNKSNLF
jgi:hypothetical protein